MLKKKFALKDQSNFFCENIENDIDLKLLFQLFSLS